MKWGVRHDPEPGSKKYYKQKYKSQKKDAVERMKKTGQKLTAQGKQNDMKSVNKMVNRYESDLISARKEYKSNVKKNSAANRFKTSRQQSLKKANYQRYSKKNNPISVGIKARKDLYNYRLGTAAAVKKQKTGKAKVKTFMKRYANEPVTGMGFTGTTQSTRLDYLKGKYPGYGLY